MSTPFQSSFRALESDRFRPSVVGMVLAGLILLLWGAWFFGAKITLYETSQQIIIQPDGMVFVQYPAEQLGRLKLGQKGWLRLEGDLGSELGQIPLLVIGVLPPHAPASTSSSTPANNSNSAVAQLIIMREEVYPYLSLDSQLTGSVEIEVESLSPFRLILRSAGQNNGAQISTSPQNSRGGNE